MTVHTEVKTSDALHRYFRIEKSVLADPLNHFIAEHLQSAHGLDVFSGDYTRAMYAHRLALGEGDASLRDVLTQLRNQASATGVIT